MGLTDSERELADSIAGLTELEWADWWREKGWILGVTELRRYVESGFVGRGEWIDEFRSMALHGTGVSVEEWLGIMCLCCEMWRDSEGLLFLVGDVGFSEFRSDPAAEESLTRVRQMFPGVDRCLSLVDEYYAQLDAHLERERAADPGPPSAKRDQAGA